LQLGFLCLLLSSVYIFRHIEGYFFVYSMIFSIPSVPLVHISGAIIISHLVCSVSVHRTWSTGPVSQKGHCGFMIPFIRGPWVALVYPVLSLISTCSLLVMPLLSPSYSCSIFLPFMLLLPFLHRSFLIFVFPFLTIFLVLLYVIIQRCLRFLIYLFVGLAYSNHYPHKGLLLLHFNLTLMVIF
jgi:hypothetical protein